MACVSTVFTSISSGLFWKMDKDKIAITKHIWRKWNFGRIQNRILKHSKLEPAGFGHDSILRTLQKATQITKQSIHKWNMSVPLKSRDIFHWKWSILKSTSASNETHLCILSVPVKGHRTKNSQIFRAVCIFMINFSKYTQETEQVWKWIKVCEQTDIPYKY